MAEEQKKDTGEIYEIKIHGQLDTKWSEWFYGMTIIHERDGSTTLCGPLPDQTVLHSVLDRIRDMNLQLISVNKIMSEGQTIDDEVKGVNHEEQYINITKKEKRTMKTNHLSKSTRLNKKGERK